MSRGYLSINKVSEDSGYEEESSDNLSPWMKRFVSAFSGEKETAVEAARKRNAQSIVYQINNTMKNPPRYATVEDAVQDMIERTGLNKQLKTSADADKKKTLSNKEAKAIVEHINREAELPKALEGLSENEKDAIISFIKNNVENVHAQSSSIPQIQYELKSKFRLNEADLMNEDFIRFINEIILRHKSKIQTQPISLNIGKGVVTKEEDTDSGNQDYFGFADPVKR